MITRASVGPAAVRNPAFVPVVMGQVKACTMGHDVAVVMAVVDNPAQIVMLMNHQNLIMRTFNDGTTTLQHRLRSALYSIGS